jgi:hypothetical protein
MARSMEDMLSLAVSGTLEAVLTASTHAEQAASMLSTLIWRVFSGLSHLHDTRIVGRLDFTKPSAQVSSAP